MRVDRCPFIPQNAMVAAGANRVPVHQGLVAGDRVQQGGHLVVQRPAGILAEGAGPWSGHGGLQQPQVADLDLDLDLAERPFGDVQPVLEVPVDHWPSRSSASP